MHLDYFKFATDLWIFLAICWLIGMLATKPVVRTQSVGSRILVMSLSALAYALVFSPYFRTGWLAARFIPSSDWTGAIGLALTFLGVLLSIAARLQLGGNWSGTVTIKEHHTLICRGPYSLVRHPIYSGFLLAFVGLALILGEVRGILALAILFLALWLKADMEERFMLLQFGEAYRQYQRKVKALIPFIY